ncbi:Y-family DNA polymerase [Tenuifilum thalassicum]|uniref:Y-family DNA polymerase n=1 Tax=Tenuifilum thalassicum TaxID=2590900 RepID=A0A7D4BF03_9BACT|nr:Y-family DNA polymerase [Tenuifilum thalassicum]QKG80358.1 Y-family DNA polymerase [Tenuifilum thalassicum]
MYVLADCNNFYASCERVFNPSLIGKPVIVLSNNDGCVIARSNEAKALGIKMGEPAFKIKDTIERHNVAVFSSNYTLYGDMSQRVMNTLASFTPDIEIYSIDEAFLGLHGFRYVDLIEYASQIRKTTMRNTGIPISLGIAPTKTLAKVANHIAKKQPAHNGVYMIATDEQRVEALKNYEIGEVWGIGRQYSKFLMRYGVNTAYDFTKMPAGWVRRHMSVVGLRTQKELLGIPCIDLEHTAPPKKAIATTRSFGEMQTDLGYLKEAVASFAANCAHKLRKQKSVAQIVMVFAHTNYFRDDLPQYSASKTITLPVPTSSSIELAHYAIEALKRIYKPGYSYKKAGVIVSGISTNQHIQTSLFDTIDREKHNRLMAAMDKINDKYGRGTVKIAAQGAGRKWKLRQEKVSPKYTTSWSDIITIKV